MDLATVWFVLIGALLVVYASLDGFDLGVGVMHLFARSQRDRVAGLAAIGPFWDGNEVWLLAGGGALFAAFPVAYATVFSGFYLAFMLLLAALIFRAVAIEFRSQVNAAAWRWFWDIAFGLGSVVPALLYGIALGNVLRGLPIDAEGPLDMPFLDLLNPYALLIGCLVLAMFVMQGGAFLAARTAGDLQKRSARWATCGWVVFVLLYVAATIATVFAAPHLLAGILARPLFWVAFAALLLGIVGVPVALRFQAYVRALLASTLAIASLVGLAGISLFPRIVPSSVDLSNSLTIHNAASTPLTHKVMLIIAALGLPLVIVYTVMIYKIFSGKIDLSHEHY